MSHNFKKGDSVSYIGKDKIEIGIVKSVPEDKNAVFVVYNCAGAWEHYEQYTAARTNVIDLVHGWFDDMTAAIQSKCDHYYLYTNAKHQPVTQMRCANCGKVIE